MDLNLESKRALVCGSSQGIGRAIALELAEEGVEVTLFARNKLSLEKVLGELKQTEGKTHRILVADFTKPEEVAVVLESDIAEHGAHDIVINNTGGPKPGPAHQADFTEYIDGSSMVHDGTNYRIDFPIRGGELGLCCYVSSVKYDIRKNKL